MHAASVDGLVEASRQSRVCGGAANEVMCAVFRVLMEVCCTAALLAGTQLVRMLHQFVCKELHACLLLFQAVADCA